MSGKVGAKKYKDRSNYKPLDKSVLKEIEDSKIYTIELQGPEYREYLKGLNKLNKSRTYQFNKAVDGYDDEELKSFAKKIEEGEVDDLTIGQRRAGRLYLRGASTINIENPKSKIKEVKERSSSAVIDAPKSRPKPKPKPKTEVRVEPPKTSDGARRALNRDSSAVKKVEVKAEVPKTKKVEVKPKVEVKSEVPKIKVPAPKLETKKAEIPKVKIPAPKAKKEESESDYSDTGSYTGSSSDYSDSEYSD